MKTYQSLGKPYTALADIFKNGVKDEESDGRLIAEAQYAQLCWRDDSNEGLVKQVIRAYRRFSVQHLEQTYTALTVGDVSRRTSPDPNNYSNTANYLLRLISMGHLNATISQPSEDPMTWVVHFNRSANGALRVPSEEQQYNDLRRQTEKISMLMEDVREADRQFGLSKEYITDGRKHKKAKENGHGDEDAIPGLSLHQDNFPQDEDMMEDL